MSMRFDLGESFLKMSNLSFFALCLSLLFITFLSLMPCAFSFYFLLFFGSRSFAVRSVKRKTDAFPL